MALALDHTFPVSRLVRGNSRHLHLLPTPAPIVLPRVSASTYRRRRLVAMAVIALLGAVGFGALSGTRAKAGPTAGQQVDAPRVIIAQSGDTLWAIARRVAPQGNIAELVEQLVVLNGDAIQVGQQVRIP
jgi:nucleoid-associated protein YgaU